MVDPFHTGSLGCVILGILGAGPTVRPLGSIEGIDGGPSTDIGGTNPGVGSVLGVNGGLLNRDAAPAAWDASLDACMDALPALYRVEIGLPTHPNAPSSAACGTALAAPLRNGAGDGSIWVTPPAAIPVRADAHQGAPNPSAILLAPYPTAVPTGSTMALPANAP
jgi:hypothetical protein